MPNITPDPESDIVSWKREEIADLLLTGTKPDFDNVQALMYEVIQAALTVTKICRKKTRSRSPTT